MNAHYCLNEITEVQFLTFTRLSSSIIPFFLLKWVLCSLWAKLVKHIGLIRLLIEVVKNPKSIMSGQQ